MENVFTALSISLISNHKRFVIVSNDSKQTLPKFTNLLTNTCSFDPSQYCVIDLLTVHTTIDLIHKMTNYSNNKYYLKNVIIWQNVQYLTLNQHKSLYKLILQIDQYEMTGLKDKPIEITIGNNDEVLSIERPELFTIVMVLDYLAFNRKPYIFLKEKFWFAVNYNDSTLDMNYIPSEKNYQDTILKLRLRIGEVYISPDIKKYIYSLIVFTRCHRLTSLAPKLARLPTATIDYINDFCKSLILWQNRLNLGKDLFVTPGHVKLAFRKIGYWLVDWEYNEKFAKDTTRNVDVDDVGTESNLEYEKRLAISMLTGDWYGSDYFFVNEYLKNSTSKLDKKSPTGYTNRIIEDVISSVRPPL